MAPVYASDLALPRRPQDSVPACPLRLWPGETLTHKSSSASPNALRQVQQIGHGKRTRLKSGQGTSLCSIGNDHPFVPTCRLAERRRFESCCTHHQNQNLAGRRPEQRGRCPNLKVGRFSYCVRGLKELGAGPANPNTGGARPAIRASPRRKRAKYLDTRSGRIRLAAIPDNSAASIEAFVRANVKPGTTLLTDGHRSYPGLTDYRHDPRTVGKMAGHIV